MGTPLLDVKNLNVHYRAVHAVNNVSFGALEGEILTLIGSNGAGKSSILKAISGLVKPSGGDIHYGGNSLVGKPVHSIVSQGICQAPEGRGIFLNLTVEENLDLGAWSRPSRATLNHDLAHAYDLFPRLKERRTQNAGTLSGGEQQMLAIARALMAHPKVLLLDEPSLGLAPLVIEKIFEIIVNINKAGMTILLVEQNALQALQIAHYGVLLETGSVVLKGKASELLNSEDVRKAYLGG